MKRLRTKYFFQKKKRSFARKFFEKGLSATSFVLLSLNESGKMFLSGLPNSYPQFRLVKEVFGATGFNELPKEPTIKASIRNLIKQGLVAKDEEKEFFYLTDKGKELVVYIKDRHSILKKPWDGKLRLVIFDIPEEKKYWREMVREELLLLQFQQLQKSVYVGKYPLPESFYKDLEEKDILKYVFVFTINETDRKESILELIELQED